MTTYTLDASTHRPPGSDVVIGGSPLRLFRLTPSRHRRCSSDIAAGERRRPRPGRRPPRRPPASTPARSTPARRRRRSPRPTSPSSCRRSCSASRRSPRSCAAARRRRRHRRRRRVRPAGPAPSPAPRVLRLRTNAGPAVARNAGLGAVDDAARRVRRHRRPARARLARSRCSPTSPTPRVGLVAPRVASAPGCRSGRRLRAGALAARPRPRAGPHRAGHPAQLRPGGRARRAHRRPARDRRLRPHAALRRGRRRRVAPRRGRVALPVRTGVASSTTGPRGSWRGARRPARRLRLVGRPAGQAPPGRAGPGAHQRVERRRRGRCWPPASRSPPLAVAGGTAARARAQAARRARRPSRCASPGSGHLHAGRLLADAGRRAWWPLLARRRPRVARGCAGSPLAAAVPALLGGGIPRLVDDLAYGVGVWKGVLAEREPGPLRPRFTSWPGRVRPTA